MKNESKKTLITESRLPEAFTYSSSIIDIKEAPDEISDKISKMMPDMGVIRATGIIKNTESFKESKQILGTFKKSLHDSPTGVFDEYKPVYSYEESDGKPALESAIDSLQTVVRNMVKAGIKVDSIYKDFLHAVRPPEPPSELEIINQPPLFKITGLDENGEVVVKTDTPIVLKKGKTEIALTHEKLTDTVVNSQKVDCKNFRELHNWVKQNVYRAGSMEKLSDQDWANLRTILVNSYKTISEKNNIDNNVATTTDQYQKPLEETKVKIEVPQSVNMNAYEIRLKVLQEALDWVKHNKNTGSFDDVIEVANRFYKFVENKK